MPRKIVDLKIPAAFHVSCRTNNKEFLFTDMNYCWELLNKYCLYITYLYGANIHLVVLMNNHYHMLISCPDCNLSDAIKYLNAGFAIDFNKKYERNNHVFGTRFSRTLIKDYDQFFKAYKYVIRNPLRANICNRIEDYKYNTFNSIIGLQRPLFPIYPESKACGFSIGDDFDDLIEIFNEPFQKELEQKIKLALKKTEFKINMRNKNGFNGTALRKK